MTIPTSSSSSEVCYDELLRTATSTTSDVELLANEVPRLDLYEEGDVTTNQSTSGM